MFHRNLKIFRNLYNFKTSFYNGTRYFASSGEKTSSGCDNNTKDNNPNDNKTDANAMETQIPEKLTADFPICEPCDVEVPPQPPPTPVCVPPRKIVECKPICSDEKTKVTAPCPPVPSPLFRLICLCAILPFIIILSAYVFYTREEIERPPFVPYTYMRKRNFAGRKWPWNSDKTLFHNPRVNALYDGYEDELDPLEEKYQLNEPD